MASVVVGVGVVVATFWSLFSSFFVSVTAEKGATDRYSIGYMFGIGYRYVQYRVCIFFLVQDQFFLY